jgi:MFS family permease
LNVDTDWRVLPVLGVTYGLQSMDKGALGVAAVFGITSDLGLICVVSTNPLVTDSSRYSYASMIFFCGFVLGSYPLAMIAQRFPIGRVCAIYCLVWGIVCILTLACFNYPAILAQRFFLGFVESGVSPAFLMLISSWYTKPEQAFRSAFMYAMPGLFTM